MEFGIWNSEFGGFWEVFWELFGRFFGFFWEFSNFPHFQISKFPNFNLKLSFTTFSTFRSSELSSHSPIFLCQFFVLHCTALYENTKCYPNFQLSNFSNERTNKRTNKTNQQTNATMHYSVYRLCLNVTSLRRVHEQWKCS